MNEFSSFAELAMAWELTRAEAVIDGELACLDKNAVPNLLLTNIDTAVHGRGRQSGLGKGQKSAL